MRVQTSALGLTQSLVNEVLSRATRVLEGTKIVEPLVIQNVSCPFEASNPPLGVNRVSTGAGAISQRSITVSPNGCAGLSPPGRRLARRARATQYDVYPCPGKLSERTNIARGSCELGAASRCMSCQSRRNLDWDRRKTFPHGRPGFSSPLSQWARPQNGTSMPLLGNGDPHPIRSFAPLASRPRGLRALWSACAGRLSAPLSP